MFTWNAPQSAYNDTAICNIKVIDLYVLYRYSTALYCGSKSYSKILQTNLHFELELGPLPKRPDNPHVLFLKPCHASEIVKWALDNIGIQLDNESIRYFVHVLFHRAKSSKIRNCSALRNYSMGQVPDSFPVAYTASPQLQDGAIGQPTWQYWSITDCKQKLAARCLNTKNVTKSIKKVDFYLFSSGLSGFPADFQLIFPLKNHGMNWSEVAVLAIEETDGQTRLGRCKVYNGKGQKAAEGIPDALMPRLQFVAWKMRMFALLGAGFVAIKRGCCFLHLSCPNEVRYPKVINLSMSDSCFF